jgi:hypothetical protein
MNVSNLFKITFSLLLTQQTEITKLNFIICIDDKIYIHKSCHGRLRYSTLPQESSSTMTEIRSGWVMSS